MKLNKKIIFPIVMISLFACIFIVLAFLDIASNTPLSSFKQTKTIEIRKGYTLNQIATLLKRENLIRYPSVFLITAHLRGVTNRLKAGEYRLSTDMTQQEILKKLYKGDVVYYSLTIPEGYTIKEIAQLLGKKNLLNKDTFLALTKDKEFLRSLGIEAETLEGYLFPETYFFPKGTKEEDVIRKMVEKQNELFNDKIKKRLEEIHFTRHEILTLASLIEKEAKVGSERELISAVFHNRLKKKMLLQADPTVIYALKHFDGNIKKRDLKYDSPYNTYLYPGLPPAPIANPGKDSIMAALYPAQVDYLYFVSKNNGEHYFSSTLKEHHLAVRKYQLRK